VPVRKRG